jgi:hypothetical protein
MSEIVVITARLLSLVLLLTAFGPLPALHAQVTGDGSENVQGAEAVLPTPSSAAPDDYQNHAKYPEPYAYSGLGLSRDAGYGLAYGEVGVGFMVNTRHFIANADATYDNGRKVSDGTGNNPKGHDRSLGANTYYKFRAGWFLGAGASWSQLSTTNYSKQAWNPSVGGGWDYLNKNCAGEDCVFNWSLRAQVDYLLPGSEHVNRQGCSVPDGQCTNGVQGPQFLFYLPSPASNSHFILREALSITDAHATVTSTDPTLTAEQLAEKSRAGFAEFTLMYRF